MVEFIRMPALGQTTDDLVILNWFKSEGDSVKRGEMLLEVETDKATLEVESAANGTLLRRLYEPGTTVTSGTVIAYIGQPGEELPGDPQTRPSNRPEATDRYEELSRPATFSSFSKSFSGTAEVPDRYEETDRLSTRRPWERSFAPPRPAAVDAPPRPAAVDVPPEGKVLAAPVARRLASDNGIDLTTLQGTGPRGSITTRDVRAAIDQMQKPASGKVLATPVARRLAREHDVDLTCMYGTGPAGRITTDDVRAYVNDKLQTGPSKPVSIMAEDLQPQPRPERSPAPFSAIMATQKGALTAPRHRQTIASRLQRSIQTIPQINLRATADMRAARHLLSVQRAGGMSELTYTHLFLRAAGIALAANPELNALWIDSQPPAIRNLNQANVGLVIASDDNLLVASITEPGRQSISELVRSTSITVDRARRGALNTSDMQPVSLSISNLGMYNIDSFDAIIDPGQTAILAIGRIVEQVTVKNGGIHVLPQVHLTLSIDHRIADGVAAARLLDGIRDAIENLEV